jgi:hypothetical protein
MKSDPYRLKNTERLKGIKPNSSHCCEDRQHLFKRLLTATRYFDRKWKKYPCSIRTNPNNFFYDFWFNFTII